MDFRLAHCGSVLLYRASQRAYHSTDMMRRLYLLLLLLVLGISNLYGQSPWKTSLYVTESGFTDFAFGSHDTGIVTNFNSIGSCYRTSDGGKSWNPLVLPVYHYFCIVAASPTDYYIGGALNTEFLEQPNATGIVRSTDAGLTWTIDSLHTWGGVNSISFPTRDTGYALTWTHTASKEPRLFKTIDRGVHWDSVHVPDNLAGEGGFLVSFRDGLHGMATRSSDQLGNEWTSDGGRTWGVDGLSHYLACVPFASKHWLTIVSSNNVFPYYPGVVYNVADGGADRVQLDAAYGEVFGLCVIDSNQFIFCNNDSLIKRSVDGGQHWWPGVYPLKAANHHNRSFGLTKLKFFSPTEGYFLSDTALYYTNTGIGDSFVVPKDVLSSPLTLSPNPTSGYVDVRIAEGNLGRLIITNTLGQTMAEFTPFHTSSYRFDLSTLAAGVYFLREQTTKWIVMNKIIRE
jgi:hypothetical protein